MTTRKGSILFAITQIIMILILLLTAFLDFRYGQRFIQVEGENMEINLRDVKYVVLDGISYCGISFVMDSVLNAAYFEEEGSIIQYKTSKDTLFFYPLIKDQNENANRALSLKLPPDIELIKADNSYLHITGSQYSDQAHEGIRWQLTGSMLTFDPWTFGYYGYFSIHEISAKKSEIHLSENTMFESMQIDLRDTSSITFYENNAGIGIGSFSLKADDYSLINLPGYVLKGINKRPKKTHPIRMRSSFF